MDLDNETSNIFGNEDDLNLEIDNLEDIIIEEDLIIEEDIK
jgi:hypothetical protein